MEDWASEACVAEGDGSSVTTGYEAATDSTAEEAAVASPAGVHGV